MKNLPKIPHSHRLRAAALTAAVGVFVALPAFAQGTGADLGLGYATAIGLASGDVRTVASRIISYFLGLLGIVTVLIMLYAGFLWMTSGGSEEKVQTAKKWMVNGVIGLMIVMSAFAITQFIFRAITGENGGGSSAGSCPPGQVCGGGSAGLGGGGLGGFKITGITPSGSGSGDKGWPKNYAFQTYFSAPLASVMPVPASWVTVTKCNARIDAGGKPQPFSAAACATVVDGVRTISGNVLGFKPNPNPPGDFAGDFWYVIRVQGGGVKDQNGRTLLCPFTPPGPAGDIASSQAQSDLCDRAVAVSDVRDVTPPTVDLSAPKSPPAYCGSIPIQTNAASNDDFAVAGIEFLLDGGTSKLVDVNGMALSNSVNATAVNPFGANSVYVDLASLTPGAHKISAIAQDGVPQSSTTSEQQFTVNPPHCCNAVKDTADGETAIDCGGTCGSCDGSQCASDAECSTGFCDPSSHTCAQVPVIDSVSPMAGGSGSLITLNGRFFGATPGSVVFLGGAGDADDVVALACTSSAWTDTQIVVAVPPGAVTGPIKLVAAYGKSDQTDDARGPNLGSFTVNKEVLPGICYLSPNHGAAGGSFDINGAGFGAAIGTSAVAFGSFTPTVANGGWTDTKITVITPPAPEKTYVVSATVNGKTTNKVNYLVQGGAQSTAPTIVAVSPESGPIGSYITLQGSGFGSLKGTVKFKFGADIAAAEDPVCADSWHTNYVTVKVPKEYLQGAGALQFGALPGVVHKVQIVTAPPAKSSNEIEFRVTNEPLRPGICAITPDNGRPGKAVQISGEGFGTTAKFGPTSAPRYSADFFRTAALHCLNNPAATCSGIGTICANPADGVCAPGTVASSAYSSWSDGQISTIVAGDYLTKSTWPATGPVYVVANNQLSSNAVPFMVGDCKDAGASCPAGTSCCANGSCQNSCAPAPRASAYGWLFSTNVLPELPVVIENSLCRHDPLPEIVQSPSPYKDSTDACRNAEVRVQFNKEMQMDNGSLLAAVTLQECGSGPTASCGTAVANVQFAPRSCGNPPMNDHCKVLSFTPPANYNAGTPFFKPSTWYRVVLKSDPAGGTGFKQSDAAGRYLDGNFDRKAGGDYVFTFRVSASDASCALANVFVDPSATTIDQDVDPVRFQSLPTGANCNSLQCSPSLYTLAWAADALYLDISKAGPLVPPNPDSSFCVKPVRAKQEVPGTPLRATMSPIGTSATKSGESDVTVKFAEPHVVDVTPIGDCKEACINAAIVATFNVPMDPASLAQQGNVELLRCRNASCTAPFLPLEGTMRVIDAEPPDETRPDGSKVYKHVALRGMAPAGYLKPSTFYIVRIKGGANGVRSRSGVPLAGLNDGGFYRWQFRTKDDATACLASRATITPSASSLFYIGEKRDLRVQAFGSPDSCNKAGQELLADAYSWSWSFLDPNHVLGGFIDGSPTTPIAAAGAQTLVNTNALAKPQCTAQCVLRGSQNAVPQCGDGVVDAKFEQCDPPGMNCSANCLFTGTADPTCGNGKVDAGETCDKSLRCVGGANVDRSCATAADCPGGSCDSVFPNGCKNPGTHVDGFTDGLGCVDTGSSTAKRSVCGDGFVSDGEACDDGNTANGDGCSADCLKEGTKKSCLGAAAGEQCINFCGNGVVEPGEEPECEKGPSPSANGCNPSTCLKNGTPKCVTAAGSLCCGNGKAEPGEDAACETDPDHSQFCTDRCVLKGSSAFYPSPSFCGDGLVGEGERAECEQSPDTNIDPYQVTVAEPQPGFDATSSAGSTSTVIATTTGIAPTDAGKAKLSLSCTCKTKPSGSQDTFCAEYGAGLACATNGCCAERPKVQPPVLPPDMKNDACRNSAIRVSFDQLMDVGSLTGNIKVGYDNGMDRCPANSQKIALGEPVTIPVFRGVLARLREVVTDLVHTFIIRPVFGAAAGVPDAAHTYCSVKANLESINVGEPATVTSVNVNIQHALPANTWIVVRVLPGAKSVLGVGLGGNGFTAHFGTGKDVCKVSHVFVTPASMLFSNVNQPAETVTAHAYTSTREEIVSTAEYGWAWDWTPQASISPVVLDPVLMDGKQTDLATVRVRGSRADLDGGFVPKNGEAVIEGGAIATPITCHGGSNPGVACTTDTDCKDGGACTGVRFTGEAQATVMLCENPWPSHQVCAASPFTLPWDANPNPDTCTPGARFWYPFYDPKTNFKFYYCRDGKAAGDSTPVLPALRETPVVIQPGRDIVKEYLFTYDTAAFPANGAAWERDAIGLRISYNNEHVGVARWYTSKGFNGAPTPMKVDGYDALKDNRTLYVNAAAMNAAMSKFNLYTNINTLSYTDNAAPETVNVYNQIVNNIDFNRNDELQSQSICRDALGGNVVRCNIDLDCRVNSSGVPVAGMGEYTCDAEKGLCLDKDKKVAPNAGVPLSCADDLDCQADADGAVIKDAAGKPARVGFVCDNPKEKLVRDVRRWADLQSMREYLLEQKSGNALPKLDAGTFLVTLTNSAWPSWGSKLLSSGKPFPADPVNKLGWCEDVNANRNGTTCWSDKTRDYVCPVQSHAYQYEYFQETDGANFRLRADFENGSDDTKTWAGKTCPELSDVDCVVHPECTLEDSGCNYKVGKLLIGGVNPLTAQCTGTPLSSGGVCGDGFVNPAAGEKCEPSQQQAVTCDDMGRTGAITQICTSDCKGWIDKPDAKCETGKCGDGVIQPPEICDDGTLNGKYGHCDATCTGTGFSCGDGKRQPGEVCDCKDWNGQYALNGVIAPAPDYTAMSCGTPNDSTPSCSWDCSAPGPRCGDSVVNGTEVCDGGFQEFKGYCSDAAQTGCNSNADCPAPSTCGNFCPKAEQREHRVCQSNDPALTTDDAGACTWGTWVCTAPGFCGNGKVEAGEQCDDGNSNNNDGCVIDPAKGIMCKKSTCGDGYVNPAGGEQCDEGANNNRLCSPKYGLSCTYCQSSCKLATISGGYCGDNLLQTPATVIAGPEECEGAQGLAPDEWVCVSTRPEDQSIGKKTGDAVCSNKSCLRTCAAPDSRVCHQMGDLTMGVIPGGVPGGGAAAAKGGGGGGGMVKGGVALPPSLALASDAGLKEECDPDKDNDGVPASQDCDDLDSGIHPAYHLDYVDEKNAPKVIDILAAPMVCNHKDNACNGRIDDVINFVGKVINARDKSALANAEFKVWCAGKEIAKAKSDKKGEYALSVPYDPLCSGAYTISGVNSALVCADSDSTVNVTVSHDDLCKTFTVPDLILVPRPGGPLNPNLASMFITWKATRDMDFYVKDQTRIVGYNYGYNNPLNHPASEYNGSPPNMDEVLFDVDDTTGPGPETISFRYLAEGRTYRFYAVNFDGSPWDMDTGLKAKLFDQTCAQTTMSYTDPYMNGKNFWGIFDAVVSGGKLLPIYTMIPDPMFPPLLAPQIRQYNFLLNHEPNAVGAGGAAW